MTPMRFSNLGIYYSMLHRLFSSSLMFYFFAASPAPQDEKVYQPQKNGRVVHGWGKGEEEELRLLEVGPQRGRGEL
jgi:hypothetical protein